MEVAVAAELLPEPAVVRDCLLVLLQAVPSRDVSVACL